MSAAHLATRDGSLCDRAGRWSPRATRLEAMTCRSCEKRLALVSQEESAAAAERAWLRDSESACRAVGMSHLWDAVDGDDSTVRLLRGQLGALARYFHEQGVMA